MDHIVAFMEEKCVVLQFYGRDYRFHGREVCSLTVLWKENDGCKCSIYSFLDEDVSFMEENVSVMEENIPSFIGANVAIMEKCFCHGRKFIFYGRECILYGNEMLIYG